MNYNQMKLGFMLIMVGFACSIAFIILQMAGL